MQNSFNTYTYSHNPMPSQANSIRRSQPFVVLISANTIQQAIWRKSAAKQGLRLYTYNSLQSFAAEHSIQDKNQSIFVEIEFGELQTSHPTIKRLEAVGYNNVLPVSDYCLPSEAIKFARLIHKWQNLPIAI